MSRIVKAKWVTQSNKVFDVDLEKKTLSGDVAVHQDDEKSEIVEDFDETLDEDEKVEEIEEVDHQLEAIKTANEFMKNTLKASQEIKEKSQEEGFNKGYEEGYDLGFEVGSQKGIEEGLLQADQRIEDALLEVRELANLLQEERNSLSMQLEEDFLKVALEIAKKIMRYEIRQDETAFAKIFHEVIHEDDTGVKVYLSEYQKSVDLHINKAVIDRIKALSQKSKVVILKEEDRIVVETDDSVIDVSVPVQLQQIQNAIEEN
ncbi:hypothetical protein Q5O24_04525 [Eubacteriaceae bacterium ES3]|nr:hypothetical protein Q5O24_04525 [Eubacteriaceae bacterium ES3]